MVTSAINVEDTAQVVEHAARVAQDLAVRLNAIAQSMREKNDLSYAAEVVLEVTNAMQSFHLDQMVTRPLHQYQRIVRE
jgi:hypothetical protein